MTLALGVDPSLSCTAWALVREDRNALSIVHAAKFSSKTDQDVWSRARAICSAIHADLQPWLKDKMIDVAAVEMPMTSMFGVKDRTRSATSLPGYGVCVGAVALLVESWMAKHRFHAPAAGVWSRGIPTGEKNKSNRVAVVQRLMSVDLAALHGVSKAGDVADAALLAKWALDRHRLERMVG